MKAENFNCRITANVTAAEAMEAISQVSHWWAKDVTGSTEKLNDEFTVRFGETFVDFKIIEFIPGNKIVWLVTNSYLPWLKDRSEWKTTKVIFRISTIDNQTTVNFTHSGLVPQLECYDTCVAGWNKYIPGSLRQLLNNGVGQPA